jgi:hypothetical protein
MMYFFYCEMYVTWQSVTLCVCGKGIALHHHPSSLQLMPKIRIFHGSHGRWSEAGATHVLKYEGWFNK